LGILRERIEPGEPQQNGRHERMHRTLNAETATPPASSLAAQQRRFDEFLGEYNYRRPHEALEMKTPASCYQPSSRRYQAQPPRWEYEVGAEVKKLNPAGCLDYRRGRFFVCEALANEEVSLEPLGPLLLVRFRRY